MHTASAHPTQRANANNRTREGERPREPVGVRNTPSKRCILHNNPVRVAALLLSAFALATPASAQPAQSDTWLTALYYETFHVVLPEDAPEEIQYAAEIFIRYWEKCTGHEIAATPLNEGKTNVWLGPDGVTRDLLRPEELEDLGPEGYLIKTYQPSRRFKNLGAREQLIISGKTPRGTLNGVFAFFREHMGVRWLVPGMVHAPRAGYRIRPIDETYKPHFAIRESGYFDIFAQDPEISKEDLLEYRRAHGFAAEKLGFASPDSSTKTAAAITNLDSMNIRSVSAVSLPNYLEWYMERVNFNVRHGKAVPFGTESYLIPAQMDQMDYKTDLFDARWALLGSSEAQDVCLSDDLVAINERFKTLPFGPAGHFERDKTPLHRERRERITSEILSHVQENAGAHILLTAAGCNLDEPYRDSRNETNAKFENALVEWTNESRNVVVLDFVENLLNPAYPFPSLEALQQNLQWYDQLEVKGVLFATHLDNRWTRGLRPLQSYVLHSLVWDPDRMVDELVDEFLEHYFGDVAEEVKDALMRFRKASGESSESLTAYSFPLWATPALILGGADSRTESSETTAPLSLTLTSTGPVFDSPTAEINAAAAHMPLGCGVELWDRKGLLQCKP